MDILDIDPWNNKLINSIHSKNVINLIDDYDKYE